MTKEQEKRRKALQSKLKNREQKSTFAICEKLEKKRNKKDPVKEARDNHLLR